MSPVRRFIPICILILLTLRGWSQQPHHFIYDDGSGLPSNEVYSVVQDNKGFIWLGCDGGLFKYDGFRFISYPCSTQASNAKTGLVFSSSGVLYCYNFKDQIFFLERNTLHELKHSFRGVHQLVTDDQGHLYVCHMDGVSVYSEKDNSWKKTVFDDWLVVSGNSFISRTGRSDNGSMTFFANGQGIGKWDGKTNACIPAAIFAERAPSYYCMEAVGDVLWIFSRERNQVFTHKNGITQAVQNPDLLGAIHNRKITNVRKLAEDELWIFTYQGVIRYKPSVDSVTLFYPEYSFSDGIIDREYNYWFSTLQSGLIRVPELEYLVWNQKNPQIINERINRIALDGDRLYFSAVNGLINELHLTSGTISDYSTGIQADVQSFDYDPEMHCLRFNVNSHIFELSDGKLREIPSIVKAVKTQASFHDGWLIGSSHGLFWQEGNRVKKINPTWIRQIHIRKKDSTAWVAGNDGLKLFRYHDGHWSLTSSLLKGIQVNTFVAGLSGELYVVTFDGRLYKVNHGKKPALLTDLGTQVQVYRAALYKNVLLVATNQGLALADLSSGDIQWRNKATGLVSNNVQDVLVHNGHIWLATGKGLQRIPLETSFRAPKPLLYLNYARIGEMKTTDFNHLRVKEGQDVYLYTEVSDYSSGGNFQYAYRLRGSSHEWTFLPGSTQGIPITNLPGGSHVLEMKVVDIHTHTSSEVITLNIVVEPKFWRTTWFLLFVICVSLLIIYLIYQWQLQVQKRKAEQENELNASRLTAIKSQMNPHFLFNSLNSIQDLVLKKDTAGSYTYITTFSNLVRKTLNYSDKELIDIDSELQLVELYLTLEQLRFKNQFEYRIDVHGSTEGVMVPPLLIQPFIENALVHGLLHKEGQKLLTIRFDLQDTLICTIEDNGVGREKSTSINARKHKNHESFSSEAIRKRFDILSTVMQGDFGYRYEDLYEDGIPSGTRVILRIPLFRDY